MVGYFYLIGRIRAQVCRVQVVRVFRVIHHSLAANPLSAVPSPSRFGDPAGNYAVLYGAESVSCCLWEAVVRNSLTRRWPREIPRSVITSRRVVEFQSAHDLILVDLQDDGPIKIGAPPDVVHDSNHQEGRLLSAAVYTRIPNADGFLYRSRYTGHLCCAVFDRAISSKLNTVSVTRLSQHADCSNALSEYDITLI